MRMEGKGRAAWPPKYRRFRTRLRRRPGLRWGGAVAPAKIIAGATEPPHRRPGRRLRRVRNRLYFGGHAARLPFHSRGPLARVFRFCGVRPLPRSDARTPGQISRNHSFPLLAPGDGWLFPFTLWSAESGPPSAPWPRKWRMSFSDFSVVRESAIRQSAHRRRQKLPWDTPEYRSAPAAPGNARRTLWRRGGKRRRLPASGSRRPALRPQRLLASGDRIPGGAGAGCASR